MRQRLASLMDWHRATQLTDYAAFIQSARGRLDGRRRHARGGPCVQRGPERAHGRARRARRPGRRRPRADPDAGADRPARAQARRRQHQGAQGVLAGVQAGARRAREEVRRARGVLAGLGQRPAGAALSAPRSRAGPSIRCTGSRRASGGPRTSSRCCAGSRRSARRKPSRRTGFAPTSASWPGLRTRNSARGPRPSGATTRG